MHSIAVLGVKMDMFLICENSIVKYFMTVVFLLKDQTVLVPISNILFKIIVKFAKRASLKIRTKNVLSWFLKLA